jgi:hypothetical protein
MAEQVHPNSSKSRHSRRIAKKASKKRQGIGARTFRDARFISADIGKLPLFANENTHEKVLLEGASRERERAGTATAGKNPGKPRKIASIGRELGRCNVESA